MIGLSRTRYKRGFTHWLGVSELNRIPPTDFELSLINYIV